MKKFIISLVAVVAMACVANAASDIRQLIVIPSGTTAVTNTVGNGVSTANWQTHAARLVSYYANSSSNITITVSMAGSYTNTALVATTTGGATTSIAAITGTPTVSTSDAFIVSLGVANTNSSAAYIYINMHGD